MFSVWGSLWRDDDGATAVEYALLIAAIAAAIVVVVFAVGVRVNAAFDNMDSQLGSKMP